MGFSITSSVPPIHYEVLSRLIVVNLLCCCCTPPLQAAERIEVVATSQFGSQTGTLRSPGIQNNHPVETHVLLQEPLFLADSSGMSRQFPITSFHMLEWKHSSEGTAATHEFVQFQWGRTQKVTGRLLSWKPERCELLLWNQQRVSIPATQVLKCSLVANSVNPAVMSSTTRQLQADSVLWKSGDRWFGKLQKIESQQLFLEVLQKEHKIPFTELAEFTLPARQTDHSDKIKANWQLGISGRLSFQATNRLQSSADQLDVLVQAVQEMKTEQGWKQWLVIHHAWLGQCRVPFESLRKFQPQKTCHRAVPRNVPLHLGDEYRHDFQHPQPHGTQFKHSFELQEVPTTHIHLTMQVAELEPGGKETPAHTTYRQALQAGELLTTLFLNGRALGSLNEYCHRKYPLELPGLISIPLQPDLLKSGENVLMFEQVANKHQYFDDCEIDWIYLEAAP